MRQRNRIEEVKTNIVELIFDGVKGFQPAELMAIVKKQKS